MFIASDPAIGFQAPAGRHTAPTELDLLLMGGGYKHEAPTELQFAFEGAIQDGGEQGVQFGGGFDLQTSVSGRPP